MCDCINRLENKVLDSLKEEKENYNYNNIGVYSGNGFENKTTPFIENKIGEPILTFPMSFTYTFIKKNGDKSNERKSKILISCTYCPFCGEKIKNK